MRRLRLAAKDQEVALARAETLLTVAARILDLLRERDQQLVLDQTAVRFCQAVQPRDRQRDPEGVFACTLHVVHVVAPDVGEALEIVESRHRVALLRQQIVVRKGTQRVLDAQELQCIVDLAAEAQIVRIEAVHDVPVLEQRIAEASVLKMHRCKKRD